MITLHGFAGSTYTRTARLVCAEAGAPCRLVPLAFRQPAHYALHPFGRMPVLEHDGHTVYETLAIATYVDDVWNGGRLQPAGPRARARMLQWTSAAADYLYPDLVGALHGDPPDGAVAAARGHLERLDSALGEAAFLAGPDLSLADLYVYPMVEYAAAKLGEGVADGLPSLARWRSALAERPSVRQTPPG